MKRIVIFISFAVSCINVFAETFHNIILNDTTVTVEGDRLISVKDKPKVWEIDLRNEEEVFQLVSKNRSKVDYVLSGKFVNSSSGDSNTIPYLKDGKSFYKSAHLVLKRDSLPVTISVKNEVIATFQLKQRKTYQKYNLIGDNVYFVGDTIKIKKDNPNKTDVTLKNVSISLEKANREIELKDGVVTDAIIDEGDSVKCNVIIKVEYANGNKDIKEINDIIIRREKSKIWKIIGIVGSCIAGFVVWGYCIKKRRKEKKIGANDKKCIFFIRKLWPQKANSNNRVQGREVSPDDKGNFKPEPPQSLRDEGAEVVIKELTRQINELKSKLKEYEDSSSLISTNTNSLQDRIVELEKSEREKLKEIEIFSSENTTLKQENKDLQDKINAITSDNASKKDLRNKIEELKGDKNKLMREKQSKEREITEARKTITSLETKIKEKDDKIAETMKQKDEAESNLRIEKNITATLQKKINSYSRQTYYLYAIDDTLQAVDNSLKSLFANVRDENLMRRLAQPVLSGTAGLDAGLESYLTEWRTSVYDSQKQFFGDDLLNMSNDSVKDKLTEFLEQLALRDSFGKLVRLYLMTNVGWINEKMVAAGFDVDAIQTLFARFKNLFQLFNIEISYPRLFVDRFDSNLYKDNMRCEIFNYFEPSEELSTQLKKRENENLIVDVTRIGIPNSKNPTRRNAMVSLPNF